MTDEQILAEEQEQNHGQESEGGQPEPEAAAAADELAALKAELEAAQAKANEYLEGWQRERAEFANYKRRMEREQADSYQTILGSVINRVLPALDDFDRAMKEREDSADPAQWTDGIALIYRKLQAILEAEGVARIEAEGQTFDPNLHEAVTTEESDDHASGEIIEILRHGYRLGERVIRPALVRVAK